MRFPGLLGWDGEVELIERLASRLTDSHGPSVRVVMQTGTVRFSASEPKSKLSHAVVFTSTFWAR